MWTNVGAMCDVIITQQLKMSFHFHFSVGLVRWCVANLGKAIHNRLLWLCYVACIEPASTTHSRRLCAMCELVCAVNVWWESSSSRKLTANFFPLRSAHFILSVLLFAAAEKRNKGNGGKSLLFSHLVWFAGVIACADDDCGLSVFFSAAANENESAKNQCWTLQAGVAMKLRNIKSFSATVCVLYSWRLGREKKVWRFRGVHSFVSCSTNVYTKNHAIFLFAFCFLSRTLLCCVWVVKIRFFRIHQTFFLHSLISSCHQEQINYHQTKWPIMLEWHCDKQRRWKRFRIDDDVVELYLEQRFISSHFLRSKNTLSQN